MMAPEGSTDPPRRDPSRRSCAATHARPRDLPLVRSDAPAVVIMKARLAHYARRIDLLIFQQDGHLRPVIANE